MTSWLQRQRKGVLQDLATEAGITENTDDLKKDEIVGVLSTHLRENRSALADNPALKEYYDRLDAVEATPHKTARASTSSVQIPVLTDSETRPPRSTRKRPTKVKEELKEEIDTDEPASPETNAIVARTPAVQRTAARVPLPPSPAVIADAIEQQSVIIRENVERYWTQFGVNDLVDAVRESLSSVVAVQAIALLIEGAGLRRETLHMRYAFSIPSISWLNTREYAVNLPDFFELLTAGFWAPTTLWATTSFALPLLFAYFFNLTLKKGSHGGIKASSRSYKADPLTYNVTKALLTYLVYAQGIRFGGLFSDETVATVDKGLFGGYQSVLIGSGIGVLVSLYEAALRK